MKIIDVTKILLTPGNNGEDCRGNGNCYDEKGNLIECCCDECEFFMCCFACKECNEKVCIKEK